MLFLIQRVPKYLRVLLTSSFPQSFEVQAIKLKLWEQKCQTDGTKPRSSVGTATEFACKVITSSKLFKFGLWIFILGIFESLLCLCSLHFVYVHHITFLTRNSLCLYILETRINCIMNICLCKIIWFFPFCNFALIKKLKQHLGSTPFNWSIFPSACIAIWLVTNTSGLSWKSH